MKSILAAILLLILRLPATAQYYTIEGNEIKTEHAVKFNAAKSAQLSEADIAGLQIIKQFLTEKTYISLLRIEANVSGTQNDQQLSEQRALIIAAWLIKEGIDCKRLVAVGFGNTKPEKEKNRINFVLAALKGKMINGMPPDGGGKVAGDVCNVNKSSH